MSLYAYYKELPTWAKGVVAVVTVGSAFIIGKKIYTTVVAKLDQAKIAKEPGQAGSEVKKLEKEGVYPTISDAQVQAMCNRLVAAFDGCGTDETAVYDVMRQLQNDADVYKLINAYGVRKYDGCNWHFDFGDKELSLSAAIVDELDAGERDRVNKILSEKGISVRF